MDLLGIDVGGSGIKGAMVDSITGEMLTDRDRIETPQPSTPENVAQTISQLIEGFGYSGTVGCCFPTVVKDGEARTASNIGEAWRGKRIDEIFSAATGLPFVVLNDADAAGIAEMELGAGRGLKGMVITITLGTGIGSGVFYDGNLIPNIELGHMPGKDGKPLEHYASNRARKAEGLGWHEWGERLNYFFGRVSRVMTPDHFIIGGGVSKYFAEYRDHITIPVPLHVAKFRNNAGIIGAAMAALRAA
jgi:polyphosphate glucokinase